MAVWKGVLTFDSTEKVADWAEKKDCKTIAKTLTIVFLRTDGVSALAKVLFRQRVPGLYLIFLLFLS